MSRPDVCPRAAVVRHPPTCWPANQQSVVNTDGMHPGERWAWILLGTITATLGLLGSAIYTLEYLGNRRVAECQEDAQDHGFARGGDAWARCYESGDWGGN